MAENNRLLAYVYEGWEGYNRSLMSAVADLTADQLAFRAGPEMRSVGEAALHIADGRIDWFQRINEVGCAALRAEIDRRDPTKILGAGELVGWLNRTWRMVAETLEQWTVDDLAVTYRHEYQGTAYAVSRQWTIWRIMAHDIHHGGQLSELLGMQGVFPLELTLLGGHLTVPATAE